MGRRVHIEHNVHHLLGNGGIVGALEGSDTVRLEDMGGPDALDGAQRDPHLLGRRDRSNAWPRPAIHDWSAPAPWPDH